MKDIGTVSGSKAQAVPLVVGYDTVYVHTNIKEVEVEEPGGTKHTEWQYHEVQYSKDEYLAELAKPYVAQSDYIPSAMASLMTLSQLSLAQVLDEDTKIKVSGLYNSWVAGDHKQGEIYNTHKSEVLPGEEWEQTWEVSQSYNNANNPDITPGNPAWYTFNRPLHGKSPETARPWVKPSHGTTDTYKVGEYMVWTDGDIYTPTRETNYSPEEYAPDWINWTKQQEGE